MSKSLIIIGASARAAAESAIRGGYSVSAVDQFGDSDTRAAVQNWLPLDSNTELESTLAQLPHAVLLPVGGFESWYESVNSLRPRFQVLGPNNETVRQVRSIDFLRSVARDSGIDFPTSIHFDTDARLWRNKVLQTNEQSNTQAWAWLVKSTNASAGLGVTNLRESLSSSPQQAEMNHSSGSYIQQQVPGRPYGASFLATETETRLLGVCRSFTYASPDKPFLYSGSYGPLELSGSTIKLLSSLGQRIVDRSGLRGLFGVDFLHDRTSGRNWLLEINPRYTASMEIHDIFNAMENESFSIVDAHREAFMNSTYRIEQFSSKRKTYITKKIVWAQRDFQWREELLTQQLHGIAGTLRNRSEITSQYFYPSLGLSHAISAARSMGERQNADVISERFLNDTWPGTTARVTMHDIPFGDCTIAANTPILTMIARWHESHITPSHILRYLRMLERGLLRYGTQSAAK